MHCNMHARHHCEVSGHCQLALVCTCSCVCQTVSIRFRIMHMLHVHAFEDAPNCSRADTGCCHIIHVAGVNLAEQLYIM